MWNYIFTGLALIIILLICFCFYLGVFSKINIQESVIETTTFVYRDGEGLYSSVGETLKDVLLVAKSFGFHVTKAAGIYYDNPEEVKEEECRWSVGFLVEIEELSKLEKLDLSKSNLKVRTLSKSRSGVGIMPDRVPLLSIVVAVMKIYPAFKKQNKFKIECGSFEIYDSTAQKIYVHFAQENVSEYMPTHHKISNEREKQTKVE